MSTAREPRLQAPKSALQQGLCDAGVFCYVYESYSLQISPHIRSGFDADIN
jgi:hypothetical protein